MSSSTSNTPPRNSRTAPPNPTNPSTATPTAPARTSSSSSTNTPRRPVRRATQVTPTRQSPSVSANSSTASRSSRQAVSGVAGGPGARRLPVRSNTMANPQASRAGPSARPRLIPFEEGNDAHKEHRQIYLDLLEMVKTRRTKNIARPRILMFTDIEQDYDDLCAVIFLAEMHRLGAVELVGFVANHQPADQRAKFLRTVLHLLGLGHLPVAVGTAGVENAAAHGVEFYYSLKNTTFKDMPWNDRPFMTGEALIAQVLSRHTNVTALMISTLQDIGEFFDRKKGSKDFKAGNFTKFVSQGGYVVGSEKVDGTDKQKTTLAPVADMANNKFHPTQAENYTNCLAAYNLKSDAWSREAAKAARLPGTFMQELFKYGPIGAHLEWLWKRQEFKFYWDPFNWPFMDHLDVGWYLNTRLGLDKDSDEYKKFSQNNPSFATAIPHIKTILYDGCAAVGAVGDDFMRAMQLLKPEEQMPAYNRPSVAGHSHRVFGKAAKDLGGIDSARLAKVMETFLLGSMLATHEQADTVIPRNTVKHSYETNNLNLNQFRVILNEKIEEKKRRRAEGYKGPIPLGNVPYEKLFQQAMRGARR